MRTQLRTRAARISIVVGIIVLGLVYTASMRLACCDAYYYLYGAETLHAGQGLLTWPDAPPEAVAVIGSGPYLTTWPPLYPLLLSLFPTPWIGAQVVNLAAFLLAAWYAWRLLRAYVPNLALRAGGFVAIVLSPPFQSAYTLPLTESLFIALTLMWLDLLPRSRRSVVPVAVVTLALVMQRYVGVVMLSLGIVYVAVYSGGWRGVRRAILYMLPSVAALAAWFYRNYALTGTLTGHSVSGSYLDYAASSMLEYGARWLVFAILCIVPVVGISRMAKRWQRDATA